MQGGLGQTMREMIFPGINLHSRQRYAMLPEFFGSPTNGAPLRVLDAGSGNGMLAYKSHLKGNHVIGVTGNTSEVAKAKKFFNDGKGIPESKLEFRVANLYNLDFKDGEFDEIICSEVIEHLRNDRAVVERFFHLLKPGGVLHLCAPNALHPYNVTFPLDPDEKGGHVRPGYTMDSYRELLEPIGFRIDTSAKLGGPIRQAFSSRIKEIQGLLGTAAGLPVFLMAMPLLWIDRVVGVKTPFSIYVKAVKPRAS